MEQQTDELTVEESIILLSLECIIGVLLIFLVIYYIATWRKYASQLRLERTDFYTQMTFAFLVISLLLNISSTATYTVV